MVETVGDPEELPPVDSWISKVDFRSTAEVKIPERLVDQVIGQERAVEVIRKASEQKRHVMLIGDPGTGKSMLARSMTEMLPRDDLQDIIVYHNPEDPNEPKIRVVHARRDAPVHRCDGEPCRCPPRGRQARPFPEWRARDASP